MTTNPWARLKATTDVVLRMEEVPDSAGGGYYTPGVFGVITLDPRLGRIERNAVLAHELLHHQLGGGCGHPGVDRRHCDHLWGLVADQLVTPDRLRQWWVDAEREGWQVHPHDVAEVFDVPEHLAERAMRRLLAAIRREMP